MNVEKLIYEQMGMLKEYSQKVYNPLTIKFKTEKPELTDEQIKYYIDSFERLKASPKIINKDITKYTFAELEKVVDSFPKKAETINPNINTASVKGEAVYSNKGIEVYLGDERDKCVRYRKAFQGETSQTYSWCIARSDTSNMFTGYRYGAGTARIFYFVINRNLPVTDPYHVFVVHVFDNGQYSYNNSNNSEHKSFDLTSALNNGDETGLSWSGMVSKVPALKNVPESIFKAKPLTPAEIDLYNKTADNVHEDDIVDALGSYDLAKGYIEIHQHRLNTNQIKSLLEKGYDELLNLYINIGHSLVPSITELLPEPLLKNYARVSGQVIDAHLADNANDVDNLNRRRVLLAFIYKFIDQDKFKEFYQRVSGGILYDSEFDYLIRIGRNDVIRICFDFLYIEKGSYIPEQYEKMYAESAEAYVKYADNLDTFRKQLMVKYGIGINIVNIYFPHEFIFPEIKKKYPGIQGISKFLYANHTIAYCWFNGAYHQDAGFKFINMKGEFSTDGITYEDLMELMKLKLNGNTSNFGLLYFEQRFKEALWNVDIQDGNIVIFDLDERPMFVDMNKQPFLGKIEKHNYYGYKYLMAAYANTIFKKFYYKILYRTTTSDSKEYWLGNISDEYIVFVDPHTLKPGFNGQEGNIFPPNSPAYKNIYNNTLEAMKGFDNPPEIVQEGFNKISKVIYEQLGKYL